MLCKTCGSQNAPGVKFCTECGAPLEAEEVQYDAAAADNGSLPVLDAQQPYGDPNQNQQFGQQQYDQYGQYNQQFDPNQQQYNQQYQQYNNAQQYSNGQQYNNGQQYGGYNPPPPMNAAFSGMGTGLFPERSIGMALVLTFITCGLYALYWMYTITEDSNKISGEPNPTSGGMAILLTFISCGIYGWYWMYKRGEIIDRYNLQRGLPEGNNAIIYLLLDVFGFGIVSYALAQNELNKIATGRL